MSKGKYSPTVWNDKKDRKFDRNCFGNLPEEYTGDKSTYNEQTMFADYDDEGFDRYGYSCFDEDGVYVGLGSGVDRRGYTEFDYLCMSDDEFEDACTGC